MYTQVGNIFKEANLKYNDISHNFETNINPESIGKYAFKDSIYLGRGKVFIANNSPEKLTEEFITEIMKNYEILRDYNFDIHKEIAYWAENSLKLVKVVLLG